MLRCSRIRLMRKIKPKHFVNVKFVFEIRRLLDMEKMFEITNASSDSDLRSILTLQTANLRRLLSFAEIEREGFVTAEYDFDFLKLMNSVKPSVIAKVENNVIGYALVATKDICGHHELLDDLFNSVDKIMFAERILKESKYILCGQLCVDKSYRGRGLVQAMYNYFRVQFKDEFEFCITDVASDNPRSLKAHLKSGFQVIDSKEYGAVQWDIVLWDWNKS